MSTQVDLEVGLSDDGRTQIEWRGLTVIGGHDGVCIDLLFQAVDHLIAKEKEQLVDGRLRVPVIYVDGRLHRLTGL